jgi:membrane-bound acyltransferase YfiQ involved in biofilm formation
MKLRGYFYILTIFLFVIFGITFYETLNNFSWKAVTVEALILVTLGYLVFFYGKTVRPLHETRTNSLHDGTAYMKEFTSRSLDRFKT